MLFGNKNAVSDGKRAIATVVLTVSLGALTIVLPTAGGAQMHSTATPVASMATLTTRDFRVAVLAYRLSGGAAPTAEVRLAIAQWVGGSWRKKGEKRLDETYFWRTVSGPRSVCRLEIATSGSRKSSRPHVSVQLLLTPSLGCGRAHRFPLPAR